MTRDITEVIVINDEPSERLSSSKLLKPINNSPSYKTADLLITSSTTASTPSNDSHQSDERSGRDRWASIVNHSGTSSWNFPTDKDNGTSSTRRHASSQQAISPLQTGSEENLPRTPIVDVTSDANFSDGIDSAHHDAMFYDSSIDDENPSTPLIDLTGCLDFVPAQRVSCRNCPIKYPMISMMDMKHNDIFLKPGKTVETSTGILLKIAFIILDCVTGGSTLRGFELQRCRSLGGLMDKKLNEVCFVFHADIDDERKAEEQGMIEVSADSVTRLRQLRCTNQPFPKCRINISDFETEEAALNEGHLVARTRFTISYTNASARMQQKPYERCFERLRYDECSPGLAISDEQLRIAWRGTTILGGSYNPSTSCDTSGSRPTQVKIQKESFSITTPARRPSKEKQISTDSTISIGLNDSPSSHSEGHGSRNDQRSDLIDLTDSVDSDIRTPSVTPSLTWSRSQHSITPFQRPNSSSLQNETGTQRRLDLKRPQENRHTRRILFPNATPSGQLVGFADISETRAAPVESTETQERSRKRTKASEKGLVRRPGQKYTYGDGFCGAGGATRGAHMGGLKVKWGFDNAAHACKSWATNFPLATIHQLDVDDFVALTKASGDEHKVDVLHVSPPCQYFSPAHTVAGANDERNSAALLSVGELIRAVRPRVVTAEETAGLALATHVAWQHALINMFTSLGYSVRWRFCPLSQWGLPQVRRRLVIVAACPGEALPPFPAATHGVVAAADGEGRGALLRPLVTVNRAIANIPAGTDLHDPQESPNLVNCAYEGNGLLPRCITTSGGQNYHPDGARNFTIREYACLQGFPFNHVFEPPYIKTQIGNAVPPTVAKVLFSSIRKALEKADGMIEGEAISVD